MGVVHKEFSSLEAWVKDTAHKHLDKLTKILKTDLSDNEIRWECEAQIDIYATLRETWQKKLDYIKDTLTTMEKEILGAPLDETKSEEDTSKHRRFTLQKLDKVIEEAKQAFAR